MKTETTPHETTLAATIAGEDLCAGMFVSVLNETLEFPSFLWDTSTGTLAPQDLVRITCIARDAGAPLKVEGVCLPFVFVRDPAGTCRTLDVRRMQLVRLDERYAKRVRKALKPKSPVSRVEL